MVVGQDPATALSDDWWSFWDTEYGFREKYFESAYNNHHNNHGKKGSDTRVKLLNRITCNLKPELKSLETNASMGGATSQYANQDVLKLLLKEMYNLQAIIAYGKPACKMVGRSGRLRDLITLPDEAIYEIDSLRHGRIQGRKDCQRIAEIDCICAEIKRNFNQSE